MIIPLSSSNFGGEFIFVGRFSFSFLSTIGSMLLRGLSWILYFPCFKSSNRFQIVHCGLLRLPEAGNREASSNQAQSERLPVLSPGVCVASGAFPGCLCVCAEVPGSPGAVLRRCPRCREVCCLALPGSAPGSSPSPFSQSLFSSLNSSLLRIKMLVCQSLMPRHSLLCILVLCLIQRILLCFGVWLHLVFIYFIIFVLYLEWRFKFKAWIRSTVLPE